MRNIPFAGIELTYQRVRGLRGTSELPGRPAVTKDSIVLHLLGIFFFFFFFFLVRKIPVTGIRTHVPTCQKVTRLPTELSGRPARLRCVTAVVVLNPSSIPTATFNSN